MKSISSHVGATSWWNAGYTGAGVGVALIDTGVSAGGGSGNDRQGDLRPRSVVGVASVEPAVSRHQRTRHVHGGAHRRERLDAHCALRERSSFRLSRDRARCQDPLGQSGTADGGTDVSQVIAAINWVIQHRNDNGINIRVLNLVLRHELDTARRCRSLSYAVEQAWKKGIVVVAAAGNTGFSAGTVPPGLANPAYNPYVIAVGGYDTAGTAAIGDDTVGDYSAGTGGCGQCRNPDFVAVGSHMQGLRVPNSYLDANHPEGQLRHPLLPGQRHQPSGGDHVRYRRATPAEIPDSHARSGQALYRVEASKSMAPIRKPKAQARSTWPR